MWLAPGPSTAARCGYPSSYPGDDAPKAAIAAWMAGAVVAAVAVRWRGGYGQNSHSGVVAMAACAAGGG